MTHDTWHMKHDKWQMTNDKWHMTHETKFQITHYTHDTWHMTHEIWCMMHDTWCMTHDAWHMMHDAWWWWWWQQGWWWWYSWAVGVPQDMFQICFHDSHPPHFFQIKKFLTNAWKGRQHQHHGLFFTIIAKKMIIIFSAFLFCVKVGDFGCADGPVSAGPHHLHQNLQFEKKETKSPTNRGERGG